MFKLRDYQLDLRNKIYAAWDVVKNVLAVCPTGGGKTVIFSSIMHDHVGAAAAIVHRKEILGQISVALGHLDVKHRVVAPAKTIEIIRRKHLKVFGKSYIDPNAQMGVISVQTLTSKSSQKNIVLRRWLNQITLGVFDEGHHYVSSGIWGRAVELLEKAKLLFVTATPERADGKGLGHLFDGFAEAMVEGPTTKTLIDRGFLSKFRYFCPETDLDLDDIPITASGDVNTQAMRKRIIDSHLVGDVVSHYFQYANGKQTIVFANDVATAHEMAAEFTAKGVMAVALDGTTEDDVRDRALADFEAGVLQVLINVDLFDEGFDVPAVECVIMGRKTMSLAKYLQMVGRSLRILEGKLEAIIIDPVKNWERHGMPHWPRQWTLAGRTRKEQSADDTILLKVCEECTQPYEAYHRACPYCGYEKLPEGRSSPEQVDGDLFELDLAAMDALFEQQRHAEMNDEEFEQDMIDRNVPSFGRPRQLKAHQAARYRREVLRQLVGWWVGAQAGRDMSEIHRRFYHRFGIDIGTAFTLNADDTDKLLDKIKERYAEDLVA